MDEETPCIITEKGIVTTKEDYGLFYFLWRINKFRKIRGFRPGKYLRSPTFSIPGDSQTIWTLKCYPSGLIIKNRKKCHVGIYLAKVSSTEAEVKAKFQISILNAETGESDGPPSSSSLYAHTFMEGSQTAEWSQSLLLNDLLDESKGWLKDDILTIKCYLESEKECITISDQSASEESGSEEPTDSLFRAQKQLYNTMVFSDIAFIVRGRRFEAHRSILCVNSPVFAAMFTSEPDNSTQEITDCCPEIFEKVLRFIYTAQIEDVEEKAEELLPIATKYELKSLKKLCEQQMIKKMSVPNAAKFLGMADVFSASRLKKFAISFIHQHPTDVIKTSEWKNLVQLYPHLGIEVFERMYLPQT